MKTWIGCDEARGYMGWSGKVPLRRSPEEVREEPCENPRGEDSKQKEWPVQRP